MKNIISLVVLLFTVIFLAAQSNSSNTTASIKIEMLFPEGKSKALILSFDDGTVADRRLVKLLNDYGLKGTFHLCSNKLDTKGYLTKDEIKNLYKGHEVSVHSADHPALTALSKIDITYEIAEDRKELERLTGNNVRGMAYPFGNYNDFVVDVIKGLGIEYARTVRDSYNFSIPEDFLRWDPSIHQFGRAYSIPNDSVNDKKELAGFYKLVGDFLKSDSQALLDVWGHSWENDGIGNRWVEIENFFKIVSKRNDIDYTTQIALVDYINAYKNLKISVDKKIILNLSSIDVYIKRDGQVYKIPGGGQLLIKTN
ncbi:polysaccharide deacetylase [mine drainage metagenome]|uniref:Polysaccharide deacetylase n=1 Tax=mine drainage metagenome TaxID=410659 RepID=A0A1J5SBV4_9ZZZZ